MLCSTVVSSGTAQTKKKQAIHTTKGETPVVFAPGSGAEPPEAAAPEPCTHLEEETTPVLAGWRNKKWTGSTATPNQSIFRYWLGSSDATQVENYYVGINTSRPGSVFDVHFPTNRFAAPDKGLSVTTGENCSRVGLAAGDVGPSWVGSYAKEELQEPNHPFQIRAGYLPATGYWNPATGTFIHLDPQNDKIGIKTNEPQYPLDINGTVHTNEDALVQQSLAVGSGATIGYGYQEFNMSPPANGLLVNGSVGIGTDNPQATLHLRTERAGAGDLDLLRLSNRWNNDGTRKEPTITFDNGEADPYAWKLSASIVGPDYFRIRKQADGVERTHLQINSLGQTQLSARIEAGTSNRVLRLSNLYDGNVPVVENEISIDNGQATPTGWVLAAGVAGPHIFRISSELAGVQTEHLRISESGEMGLGTQTPKARLDISNPSPAEGQNTLLRLSNGFVSGTLNKPTLNFNNGYSENVSGYYGWYVGAKVAGAGHFDISRKVGTDDHETMLRIADNGNLGLGTASPATKLEVKGTAADAVLTLNAPAANEKGILLQDDGTTQWKIAKEAGSNDLVIGDGSLVNSIRLKKQFAGGPARVVIGNQDVAINGGFQDIKLACSGTGIFKELGVLPGANWSDYVFDANYQLMSLDSLAKFISANHHLPEVPSAKEVEANGIRVAEMNALLLKKVEELTLHLIDIKKKVDQLDSRK